MRTVAILYLAGDAAVNSMLNELRAHSTSWEEIAAEAFGNDQQSLDAAVETLRALDGQFDTLLLITHGRRDNVADGEVEFRARTAVDGPVVRSNWYLIAEQLSPLLGEGVALVSDVCFSSQEEFREAMERRLPAYAVAGVGTLAIANAAAGTLAVLRAPQAFPVEDLI